MDISSILATLRNYDAVDKSLLSRLAKAASSGDRDAILAISQEIIVTTGPNAPTSIVNILNGLTNAIKGGK